MLDRETDSASASDPALLAALKAPRGSTMRDIVTTIQAEQDAIIRLPLSGVVMIEGGPGTGKTAVALHRVAYLLYTHRERLARSGVLVVGPSAAFIRYVGGVLPALGESAVVFTTPGRLAHGVVATAVDQDEVARTKGGLAMLDVLRRAVADRQELPGSPIAIELDDVTVEIDRATARRSQRRARATGLPHNAARTTFRDTLGSLLVDQGVERLTGAWRTRPSSPTSSASSATSRRSSPRARRSVSAELARLRDDLRGPRLPRGGRAAVAGADRGAGARRALRVAARAGLGGRADRPLRAVPRRGAAWTVADAPLLDELAELLGPPPGPRRAAPGASPTAPTPREVLSILESADRQIAGEDPDELRPTDFVTADVLAARQVPGHLMSVAERAAADRDWRYGHLVVDEAQELSAMDWHVLCGAARPVRSPRWVTSRSAAPPRERRRGRTCSPRTSAPGGPTGRSR